MGSVYIQYLRQRESFNTINSLDIDFDDSIKNNTSTQVPVNKEEDEPQAVKVHSNDEKASVESLVKRLISVNLGYKESEIDLELSLTGLGIDSLSAIDFRNDIEKELGVVLPLDVIFHETPTRNIINMIIDKLDMNNFVTNQIQH